LVAELSFFGHFSESQLRIPLQPFLDNASPSTNANDGDETLEFMCRLTMDIESKTWSVDPYSCPPFKSTLQSRGAKYEKPRKTKQELAAEKKEREAQRAHRDAFIAKKRLALKTKKMEERKRAQRLLNGNTESGTEPPAESKEDGSNLSNGNQAEDASAADLVLDGIEAPNESNAAEDNPEDDTLLSPVHRRPSDDTSPNPYRQNVLGNDTVSASNDADLVSGDQ